MKSNHKKLRELATALFFIALLFLSFAPAAFSASDYVQLAPIPGTSPQPPCGNGVTVNCGRTNLSYYLTGMFKVGVISAGILAFLMMVWGGLSYLSTDVITGKEEGKARIQRALGGLVLALASYIILYTINPNLVSLNLNFGPAANPQAGLNAPADLITDAELEEMRVSGLTSVSQGFISEKVRKSIEDLDNKKNAGTLTPEEETQWKELNIVRDGTRAKTAIKTAESKITAALEGNGLPSSLARNALESIETLRTEVTTRIAAMAAEGATVGQMKVVRDSFNTTEQRVKSCIALRKDINNRRAEFEAYCKS